MTRVKTPAEIEAMRESGRMLKTVLDRVIGQLEIGMTLIDIDQLARKELKPLGGKPAFFGYDGFPGAICLSLNDEIVHGTPRPIEINDGDLLGLDFGVNYRGMITDSARTVVIGQTSKENNRLVETTERAMYAGIDTLKNGVHVGDVSAAIETVLSQAKLGIIRDLVGHGVGHELHEEPNIPNYGSRGEGPILKTDMTVCLEPMASLGGEKISIDPEDKWTIRTVDGSITAHFEHTILITDSGSEILT